MIRLPSRLPTLPPIISSTWATVILEGMAWGLITRSGTIPDSVNGISSNGWISPSTPFCPCLDANLSPSSGILSSRTLTFASRAPFMLSVRITASTMPRSFERMVTLDSLLCWGLRPSSVGSSRNLGGLVFPISTSVRSTITSGLTIPSSSNWEYTSGPRAPLTSWSGISNLSSCPPG